jgi:hypothetical protein
LPAEFSRNVIASVSCNVYVRYIRECGIESRLVKAAEFEAAERRYIKYRRWQTRDAERLVSGIATLYYHRYAGDYLRRGFPRAEMRRELLRRTLIAIAGGWDIYTRAERLFAKRHELS